MSSVEPLATDAPPLALCSVVKTDGVPLPIENGSHVLQAESLWLASLPATYMARKLYAPAVSGPRVDDWVPRATPVSLAFAVFAHVPFVKNWKLTVPLNARPSVAVTAAVS